MQAFPDPVLELVFSEERQTHCYLSGLLGPVAGALLGLHVSETSCKRKHTVMLFISPNNHPEQENPSIYLAFKTTAYSDCRL